MPPRKTARTTASVCGSKGLAALLAFVLVLGGTAVPAARADLPDDEKERLFRAQYDQAESEYNAKNYQAAVPRLQAAFAIEPLPQILFNIAQAYRKLFLYSDARVYYELYRSTAKDIPQPEQASLDRHIAEMRELERASQTPKVIEKTKFLLLRSEKPPPRWLRPVGLAAGITGLGALGGGIALLALHNTCTGPAVAPALECEQVYNTRLPGAVVAVAGGGLLVLGITLVALSAKRPARPVLTETQELPSEDGLLPVPSARPSAIREPPPAPLRR